MIAREAERAIPIRCGAGGDAVATSRWQSRRCLPVRRSGRRRQGLRWRCQTSRSRRGSACRRRRPARHRASAATRRLDAERSSLSHYPRTISDTSPTPRPIRRHARPCCFSRIATLRASRSTRPLTGDCESGDGRGNAARLGRSVHAVPRQDAGTGRAGGAAAPRPRRDRGADRRRTRFDR
jgi:hypothetical protein